jgi:AcrR family transcriptional regulator
MKTVQATAVKPDTSEAILDAMDTLMARYGYRKTTMDDLAREAGISKRTIYLYFPSKEEVALSSIGRVVQTAQARMKQIAIEDGDPRLLLENMLVERVMARVRSVEGYRLSLDELFEAVRPAYLARRQTSFDAEQQIITDALIAGQAAGIFTFDDASETAHDLLSATNAYLPYSLSVRELGQIKEIENRVRRLAKLLVRGLEGKETR